MDTLGASGIAPRGQCVPFCQPLAVPTCSCEVQFASKNKKSYNNEERRGQRLSVEVGGLQTYLLSQRSVIAMKNLGTWGAPGRI